MATPAGLSSAALQLAAEVRRARSTPASAATPLPPGEGDKGAGGLPAGADGSLTPMAFTAYTPFAGSRDAGAVAESMGMNLTQNGDGEAMAATPAAVAATPAILREARDAAGGVAAGTFGKGVLQNLRAVWDAHAASMDKCGREAGAGIDAAETAALGAMARIEGAPEGLAEAVDAARALADGARAALLGALEESRRLDDNFARETYALARGAFEYGTNAVHDALVTKYRSRANAEREEQERRLENCRRSGEVHLRDVLSQELRLQELRMNEEFDLERAAYAARVTELNGELVSAVQNYKQARAQKEVIKSELAAALAEMRSNTMWKQRCENEKRRAEAIKAEKLEMKRAYEVKLKEWSGRFELEVGRRDKELFRLRAEVNNLQDQLRSFAKDANIAHIRNNLQRHEDPSARAHRATGARPHSGLPSAKEGDKGG